jgi:uncharacterized protein YndB with AHSA1/START domain
LTSVYDEAILKRCDISPIDEIPKIERRKIPREFSISRSFDAPRELLFAAWTEEQHLKEWFGPDGFTILVSRLNLVPGGIFHYCMRAANGVEMWGKWIFREIVPAERIVLVNTFSNKHGNPIPHPYVPNWPLEILTTTTFNESDGKTELKIVWVPIHCNRIQQQTFNSMHDQMDQGWNGTLDQLAAYLEKLKSAE